MNPVKCKKTNEVSVRHPTATLTLLAQALEFLDRAVEAARIVREEGMTKTTPRSGAVHVHPLVRVETECRREFCRLWKVLDLHGEYVDENQAGWKHDRAAFQRLIADAQAGKFKAVLCLDQDRFSRFPPLEANYYWYLLEQTGVRIHTVAQGELKFDALADWLTASINQYGKIQYCRDISLKSTNALIEKAKRGEWVPGRPPIGYAVDENDRLILGDPDEVELVRRIFRDYLAGGSIQSLVNTLNREGIRTRSGAKWHRSAVRDILDRRLYVGDFVWNQRCQAEFTGVRDGQVNTDFQRGENDESDWIIIPNNHPAIIDRETFEAVRERCESRCVSGGVRSSNPEKYLLTGLLRCDKCGSPMFGHRQRQHEYFICGGYLYYGQSHCDRYSVRQDRVLRGIVTAIEREYTNPKTIKRLRDELHRQVKAEPKRGSAPHVCDRSIRRVLQGVIA